MVQFCIYLQILIRIKFLNKEQWKLTIMPTWKRFTFICWRLTGTASTPGWIMNSNGHEAVVAWGTIPATRWILSKSWKYSLKFATVPAEIQTGHL
jgi:hypothetical protein